MVMEGHSKQITTSFLLQQFPHPGHMSPLITLCPIRKLALADISLFGLMKDMHL